MNISVVRKFRLDWDYCNMGDSTNVFSHWNIAVFSEPVRLFTQFAINQKENRPQGAGSPSETIQPQTFPVKVKVKVKVKVSLKCR